jgi:hypothetical protein
MHDSKADNQESQWAAAAAAARSEIAKARVRISRLEESIKIFKQKEKDGESWPGQA